MAAAHTNSARSLVSKMAGRSSPNLAGAVYGTIVATAVVAGLDGRNASAGRALSLLLGTGVFLWAAHIYATLLADRIHGHHRMKSEDVSRVTSREWPLLQSSLPLAVPLAAGWLGIIEEDTALSLAIVVGVATLTTWGIVFSRREGHGLVGIVAAASVNAFVGVVIVGLKAALP